MALTQLPASQHMQKVNWLVNIRLELPPLLKVNKLVRRRVFCPSTTMGQR
jgi:hypothetical protein